MAISDGVAEIYSTQKLHDHEGAMPLVLAEVVNADDVLVIDIASQTGFLQETRLDVRIGGSRFRQNLNDHCPADNAVSRAVDFGHPAAQIFFELVFSYASGKLQSQRRVSSSM